MRSIYDNQISFLIAGDINRTDYTDVTDAYGALKQCVTVGTRKQATLEVINRPGVAGAVLQSPPSFIN